MFSDQLEVLRPINPGGPVVFTNEIYPRKGGPDKNRYEGERGRSGAK